MKFRYRNSIQFHVDHKIYPFLLLLVIPSLAAGSGQLGYGEPSSKALRLMRVLAGHSRTVANTLLDKFNIMEPVMTYVSMR